MVNQYYCMLCSVRSCKEHGSAVGPTAGALAAFMPYRCTRSITVAFIESLGSVCVHKPHLLSDGIAVIGCAGNMVELTGSHVLKGADSAFFLSIGTVKPINSPCKYRAGTFKGVYRVPVLCCRL